MELLVITVLLLGTLIARYGRLLFGKLGFSKTNYVDNTSFVMAFFSQGHKLSRVKRGKIEGLKFNAFLTMPYRGYESQMNTNSGSIIYMLELPFHTTGHVVGVSKKSTVNRHFLESFLEANNMKEIVLEGDYPNHFSIYAAPGQEMISRYILDPKAMAFTVDYCANHFWEIVGDEMYSATVSDIKSESSILKNSKRFAEQVKPATAGTTGNLKKVYHERPYGEIGDTPLNCPICNTEMHVGQYWFTCKNKHGMLVLGMDLHKIRNHVHNVDRNEALPIQHEGLHCPNCGNKMHPVDYLQTGTIIDACTKCAFRWLDSNEAFKISQKRLQKK